MAVDTKILALEIGSWLFELDEGEWAAFESSPEVGEGQRARQSEVKQSDPQETLARPKRVRITPRGMHRCV